MSPKVQKFSGWLLLLTGLAIIFWSLYSSYNIFLGKTLAPKIFQIEKKEIQDLTKTKEKPPTSAEKLQEEMEKIISQQIKEIIPLKTLETLLNLISWTFFSGILIFAGSQISSLGIKLLKK